MIPSDERLLFNVRRTLARVQAISSDDEALNLLRAVDVSLNELQLRTSPSFYREHYADGRRLALYLSARFGGAAGLVDATALPDLALLGSRPALEEASRTLGRLLEEAVGLIGPAPQGEDRDWLDRIVDWELRGHAHHVEQAPTHLEIVPPQIERDAFEAYLRARDPGNPSIEVTGFRILTGGFSKITILVDVRDAQQGEHSMVLRVEPPLRIMEQDGLDIRREYPIIQLAHRGGVPVAAPLWLEGDASKLGLRFMASRKVAGATFGQFGSAKGVLDREMTEAIAQLMAKVARTPLYSDDRLDGDRYILDKWLAHGTITEANRGIVEYWRDQAELGNIEPSPLVRYGLSWLAANVPVCDEAPMLVHGDIGLHNVLFEGTHANALLDWEAAYIGDPAIDLSYFMDAMGDGLDRELFMTAYVAAGGPRVSEYRLRYARVVTAVRMALSAMTVLRRVHDHDEAHVLWSMFGLQAAHGITSGIRQAIAQAQAAGDRVAA